MRTITLDRVSYGQPGVPRERREYRIRPHSPVGCLDEIREFLKGIGDTIVDVVINDQYDEEEVVRYERWNLETGEITKLDTVKSKG